MIKNVLLFILGFICASAINLAIQGYAMAASTSEYSVPTGFFYSNWRQWQNLENRIESSTSDVVVLDWSGRGGHVSLGDRFIRFLRNTHKYVILRSVGENYSMHSLVFCAAPHTEFRQGFLMFHLEADSDTHKVMTDWGSQEDNREHMNPCISKGIVTDHDIEEVNQDRVLYVYPSGQKEFTSDTRRK